MAVQYWWKDNYCHQKRHAITIPKKKKNNLIYQILFYVGPGHTCTRFLLHSNQDWKISYTSPLFTCNFPMFQYWIQFSQRKYKKKTKWSGVQTGDRGSALLLELHGTISSIKTNFFRWNTDLQLNCNHQKKFLQQKWWSHWWHVETM